MFNFAFSMHGTAVVILLFSVSFVYNWVIKPNFKNRWRTYKVNLKTTAVKVAKNYLDLNGKRVSYCARSPNF